MSGLIHGLVLGLPAVALIVIQLVRHPRAWEMWVALGFSALLAVLLPALGATGWGGCGVEPEKAAVTCRGGPESVPQEWKPACRPGGAEEPVDAACPPGGSVRYAYCEQITSGPIAQPINTWSALAFWLAGIAGIFLLRGPTRPGASNPNPMTGPNFFSVTYCLTVIFVAWGTFALHASFRNWGGFFDSFSIHLWLLFTIVYRVARWTGDIADPDRPEPIVAVTAIWIALAGCVGALDFAVSASRSIFSVGLAAIWGVGELFFYFTSLRKRGQRGGPLFMTFAAFGAALLFKMLSDLTGLLCKPSWVIQPHSLWHVFAALTAALALWTFGEEPARTRI